IDDPTAMTACGELAGIREQPPLLGALLDRGHRASGGITLFKSVGISPQDWAIAARIAANPR
ncbi:MAG: hypothetical protein ACREMT_00395, partial [Vulcanimicrobiaceae bacterium]